MLFKVSFEVITLNRRTSIYNETLFFLKWPKKPKKKININYIIVELTKMKLLIFFGFSQYELAGKYGVIFYISLYNWMYNYVFLYLEQRLLIRQGCNRNYSVYVVFKRCLRLLFLKLIFVVKIGEN